MSTLHVRHNTQHESNGGVLVNNLNDLWRDADCETAGHFLEFLEQSHSWRCASNQQHAFPQLGLSSLAA